MTRPTALIAAVVGIALLGAGSVARAHHAFAAEFDVNKPIKFEGKLVKWDMVNPHSWFHVDIKGTTWMIEGGSPNQLIRQGVTKNTVKIGTTLIIEGYLAKDGTNKAVGRNFVLSVRNGSNQHFLGVRERCEREPELLRHGAGFVFYALMDAVVDRYFPLLDGVDTELETIESHIFERGAARSNIQRLYALKRRATRLRHAVAPLLEVVGKLHGGRVPAVCASTQEYFRDVHDHLARINGAIDAIRDTIGTAIQVNLSMVTIEESETTKRLAAWAAIFGVCTALVGVWGMNFEHMPELTWAHGYPMALGVIALAAAVLYRRFRRAGWL